MNGNSPQRLRKVLLPAALVAGDTLFAFGALALGYWLRYASPVGRLGLEVPDATFRTYLPLLLVGVAFLIAAYAQLNLYTERLLLRKFQSIALIVKGTSLWFAAYLGLSLVLKFDPPISRLFVVIGFVCVIAVMAVWRSLFYFLLTRPAWRDRVRQRVAVLGWNDEARNLTETLTADPAHPYRFCGVIPLPDETAPPQVLGTLADLETLLRAHQIDVLVAARSDLPRDSRGVRPTFGDSVMRRTGLVLPRERSTLTVSVIGTKEAPHPSLRSPLPHRPANMAPLWTRCLLQPPPCLFDLRLHPSALPAQQRHLCDQEPVGTPVYAPTAAAGSSGRPVAQSGLWPKRTGGLRER
jgi:hypothetical protein